MFMNPSKRKLLEATRKKHQLEEELEALKRNKQALEAQIAIKEAELSELKRIFPHA